MKWRPSGPKETTRSASLDTLLTSMKERYADLLAEKLKSDLPVEPKAEPVHISSPDPTGAEA